MTDPFAASTSTLGAPALGAPTLATDTSGFQRDMQQATTATRELGNQMSQTLQIGKQFGTAIGTAFDGLILKGKSLGDTVSTLGQSLSQIAFKAAFKPLENAIGSGFNNIFANPAGLFGTGTSLLPGTPVPFAKGGVIASPVGFPLGQGTGLAGEAGAEAIMPLTRGADGRLGVAASGSSGVNVTFNVTATDIESFRRSETQVAALLSRAVGRGQRNL